jgi:hypothetical protein
MKGRVRGKKVYYINGKTISCDRNNIDFMIFECRIQQKSINKSKGFA